MADLGSVPEKPASESAFWTLRTFRICILSMAIFVSGLFLPCIRALILNLFMNLLKVHLESGIYQLYFYRVLLLPIYFAKYNF